VTPSDIAAAFGTPAYVYRLDRVRSAHADLRRALPAGSSLYYSLKANPHPALAAELARLGCRAEVSSAGETVAALAAGFPAGELLLTGPGKSAPMVGCALERGVRRFSAESPTDLGRLQALAAEHGVDIDCLLRVNADVPVAGMGLTMTGTASQFGADASWVERDPAAFAGGRRARVTGLHLYMGSSIHDEDVLLRQFEVGLGVARRLAGAGVRLEELDLGGGFGAPFARRGERPGFAGLTTRLAAILDRDLFGWRAGVPALSFESGRYLVGDCGSLVCRVLDVKSSKGRTFVVLDAGINHLGGLSGLRRLPRLAPELAGPAGRAWTDDCVVAGPLCTPLDVWSDGARLPRPRPGDLVEVPNVGAYGLTASLVGFLGHPLPVEVVLDGERPVSVSRLTVDRVPIAAAATPHQSHCT
jgi:diaminopimelate decarboxylase